MKKEDLERLLRQARVPARDEAYWDEFPGAVVRRLDTPGAPPVRTRPWRVGAALAAATACGLVLGFALWHRAPDASLRDGRILREYLAQYPGRLTAIVQDKSGLHAQLSDAPSVSTQVPVWLEIREGNELRVIATFSGQLVRCGGKDVMVLADGAGQVILVGDGLFWSHQISAGLAGDVRIRAEQIPAAPARTRPSLPL